MIAASHPVLVGRYMDAEGCQFFPVDHADLLRAKLTMSEIIEAFELQPGRYALIISLNEETVQFLPFEYALNEKAVIVANADATAFEAGRVESILRRFDVALVAGINGAVLDGLSAAGHDVEALLRGKIVWARPCAYDRLSELDGVTLLRWQEVGPAVAVECREGSGAHVDSQEWALEDENGEIVVSARLQRSAALGKVRTGVRARLEREPCGCGSGDVRIIF